MSELATIALYGVTATVAVAALAVKSSPALTAYLATKLRKATYGAATPAQLAAARKAHFDGYQARVSAAEASLRSAQSAVVDEVNSRIDMARQLAARAAEVLDDLADNGVLDGSVHSPATARTEASRLRGPAD